MKVAVVTFPGSNGDMDCVHALEHISGCTAELVWHKSADLGSADAVILPGGFAHGDYLRAGAIAQFSPVMRSVSEFARRGGPVLGICNGFQVLTEAGLLPGALLRNRRILFHCAFVSVRVVSNRSPWLGAIQPWTVLRLAVAHGQGNYFAEPSVLEELQRRDQIALQYSTATGDTVDEAAHNGSVMAIAGITNPEGNVLGMMPHPERSADPLLGSVDGRAVFTSLVESMAGASR